LATEAAKQLTYTLANPQPAGPFAQVGDDQLIALKKLAAIFEGALPKHIQRTLIPLLTNESISPQRVDFIESPQREQHPASAPRVIVPTTPKQTTPNSHHRLLTTQRRYVTPTKLHHMVRRSAGPLNLSLDMLEETAQQENHTFSLPLRPSDTPVVLKPTKIEQIIIMPEMGNAVICPHTGKSLRHSELITLLWYKIRWMRSTANEIARLDQGLKRGVKGTNTIKFIRREDVPAWRKATYGSLMVDIKAHTEETELTRLTVGGDQIECPGDKSTRTAGLTTEKMLFNITISTPGAKLLVVDIKNFYLNTPLERYEYMVVLMSSGGDL
jgi:hypothetical protein